MAQQAITTAEWLQLLQVGTLDVKGVLPWSSNYSFLVNICPNTAVWEAFPTLPRNAFDDIRAVYKPRRGERPLWDFTQGTLWQRERAAFLAASKDADRTVRTFCAGQHHTPQIKTVQSTHSDTSRGK